MDEIIPIINLGPSSSIILGYKCLCGATNRYYLRESEGRTAICDACHRVFHPYTDSTATPNLVWKGEYRCDYDCHEVMTPVLYIKNEGHFCLEHIKQNLKSFNRILDAQKDEMRKIQSEMDRINKFIAEGTKVK